MHSRQQTAIAILDANISVRVERPTLGWLSGAEASVIMSDRGSRQTRTNTLYFGNMLLNRIAVIG